MTGHGRVIARDGATVRVRTRDGDVTVGGDAVPGDLIAIEDGRIRVVRAFAGGDYPAPGHEVWRMTPERVRGIAARAKVLSAVREFFAAREVMEVDTPIAVRTPGLEVHLRAVSGAGGYLITSPEYQMKRLLCAGFERIYTVCKCFRDDESGPHHTRELTMLEWYRAWSGIDAIIADTEALVAFVAERLTGKPVIHRNGRDLDVRPPWPRLTVAEVMHEHAKVALRGDESAPELAEKLASAGIDTGSAETFDDLFAIAFVSRVEPALAAMDRPAFVTDWPIKLAALARARPDNPAIAERVEAYAGGLELANGFGELCDPVIQRRRLADDQRMRRDRGLEVYDLDDKFLAALEEGMPPAAGIALGIDRLVMLCADIADIADTLTFTAAEL